MHKELNLEKQNRPKKPQLQKTKREQTNPNTDHNHTETTKGINWKAFLTAQERKLQV